MHTSKPAVELTRVARFHPVDLQRRLSPNHAPSSLIPKADWTTELSCGPIWTAGTSGSSHSTSQQLSTTRNINLELQPTKIQIWTASCNSPIPPAYQDKPKATLKCLGSHLRVAGDSDGSPVELGGRPTMQIAIQRFRKISTILRELNQASLKMQTVNDLLTMYVGAASQHALRTTFVPKEEAVSFDNEIVQLVAACRQRRHLPTIPPPITYGRTWGGLRGAATRRSPLDSLATHDPHPHGCHWLTRPGISVYPHTNPPQSATPTPNHIVPTNERTIPLTQITRCGTPNTQIPKSIGQHNPTDNAPTTTS